MSLKRNDEKMMNELEAHRRGEDIMNKYEYKGKKISTGPHSNVTKMTETSVGEKKCT